MVTVRVQNTAMPFLSEIIYCLAFQMQACSSFSALKTRCFIWRFWMLHKICY